MEEIKNLVSRRIIEEMKRLGETNYSLLKHGKGFKFLGVSANTALKMKRNKSIEPPISRFSYKYVMDALGIKYKEKDGILSLCHQEKAQ